MSLALRVRRIGWASDEDAQSAPVSAVLTLGGHRALADRIRANWTENLLRELPQLPCSRRRSWLRQGKFLHV